MSRPLPAPAARQTAVWRGAAGLLLFACVALHLLPGHPFTRPLIDLDDKTIVGGLERVPLASYFSERLASKDAFAFPVRDLTYYLDQSLGAAWGVRTYVLTNLGLFLAYALLALKFMRRKLGAGPALIGFALLLLHPLDLELVQWVISRKHELVGLFTLLAVLLADRMRGGPEAEAPPVAEPHSPAARPLPPGADDNNEDIDNKNANINKFNKYWTPYHFAALFVLQACSLLSHPTGVFLPLWIGLALWRPARGRKKRALLAAYLAACAALSGLWLRHVTEENRDYGSLLTDRAGATGGSVASKLAHLVLGVGRGAWQLVIPERQAIYFDLQSWRNLAGLGLFALGCALLAWLWRRGRGSADAREGLLQLLLAALLFAPEAGFVMKRTDFVMADRFLFLPLPYLMTGAALLALAAFPSAARVTARAACAAALLAAIPCLAISARDVPRWDSELALYTSCVDGEGSDRCYFHFVDKLLESGCWSVAPRFEQLEAELTRAAGRPDSLYRADGGLVLGLCMATVLNQPPAVRARDLDELRARGASEESLAFSRNLLSIEEGDPFAALGRTVTLFLGAQVKPREMSHAVVGLTLGQLRLLARLPELQARGAGAALATFEARFPAGEWTPESERTGESNTARAIAAAARK